MVCACDDLAAVLSSPVRVSFDTADAIAAPVERCGMSTPHARLLFDHHLRGPPSEERYLRTTILLI